MRLPLATDATLRAQVRALLRRQRGPLALLIALQLVAALLAVSLPWLIGDIVDGIGEGATREWVVGRLVVIFVLVGAYSVFAWFAERNARVFGESVFANLREDLVDTIVHLPLSTVESAGSGDLLGRTTHDVNSVYYLVRQGISSGLVLVTTVVTTLVAAAIVAPQLVWIILLEFPLVVVVARWYLPRAIPAYRAIVADQARFAGVTAETIEHGVTVDAFRLGPQRFGIADALLIQMFRGERYAAWMRFVMFIGMVFSTLLPILAIIWMGTWGVSQGFLTAGAVTATVIYCYQIRGPFWEAVFWVDELQFAYTGLLRIFGVREVPADREAAAESAGEGPIAVENVSYEYRPDAPVLHDVSLDLVPGESLAIVGPSGAGKSTLGRMLAGIHPPTSGRVHSGGVPLVDIPESALRAKVALVTQEHHVFVGSVAQNLRLAAPGATDDALWAALESVGAARWVRVLDGGLDAAIGSGGQELSPARAQQIALARVVLLDPETLVLDEATSLLDPSVAREAEAGLGRVLEGRTVVAIAHRLDTAAAADRVAVMVDGRIVELGTHEELVAAGGEYAHLWQAWKTEV